MSSFELEKLKEITSKLPSLSSIADLSGGGAVEYNLPIGHSFGFGLYKTEKVAVQRAFMSAKSEFPIHCHNCHEYIIIYSGRARYSIGDKVTEIGVGECAHFPPNVAHIFSSLEDVWMLAITVPAEQGYPDGSRER